MQDLQVSMEAANGLERRLRVSVPSRRVEEEVENRLRSVGRSASVKGYRPGKVPPRVIRQRFGDQVRREVMQDLLNESYTAAVARENLRPAGGPRIEAEQAAEGNDLTYVATFEVFPEIEIKGVDQIRVEHPEAAMDDADVDFAVDNLRRQRSHWHTVDRPARAGDRVVMDFEGHLDGKPIEGGRGEQVAVVVGSGRLIPDFERQLEGLAIGANPTLKVSFPDDYSATELAGRAAEFVVRVHDVAEEHLPQVDAEFVRAFGVASGEEADLRQEVRRSLEQEFQSRARADLKRQMFEQLLAANPVTLPNVLVDDEAGQLQAEAMRNLGISDASQAPPLDSYRETAERRVRLGLLIGAVIRENQIRPDQDRVRQRVDELAKGYQKPDEVRKIYYQRPDLFRQVENAVLEEQVVDWLAAKVNLKPVPTTFRDLVGPKKG